MVDLYTYVAIIPNENLIPLLLGGFTFSKCLWCTMHIEIDLEANQLQRVIYVIIKDVYFAIGMSILLCYIAFSNAVVMSKPLQHSTKGTLALTHQSGWNELLILKRFLVRNFHLALYRYICTANF